MFKSARANWRVIGAALASAVVGLFIGVSIMSGGADAPGESRSGGPRGPGDGARGSGERGQRPPAVTLVAVTKSTLDETLRAIGTGRALQSLTLTADVAGVIEQVAIKSGESVAAGAPLVVLDDDEQKIAVARARADYNIARTNASRFEGLVESEAASALENEAALNALTAATAALRQAEWELERRTIRAPFAGVVGLTELDVGDFLSVGATVTTIDDVSSILVDFVIPEGASSVVKEGFAIAAEAQAAGGREVKGVVRAIDSRVDPASRTRRVEAVLDNPDRSLIPGSTFSIALDARGREAFVVPGLAIQYDRAGAFVWRVGADGGAERVGIEILKRTADSVLVNADFRSGDRIVGEGADLVRSGVPLKSARAGDARFAAAGVAS